MEGIFTAWGRILAGDRPSLSVEITRECPLRCPGCYAYGDEHLGGNVTLRQVSDFKGQELIDRFFELIAEHRPLHVSIVGGEPLVRFRELNTILPRLADRGIYTQLVTSAVRPVPAEWAQLRRLQIVVSIDGLQPEHDARRKPATYDRIVKHIKGHGVTVHCTVTRQQVRRDGYLDEFVRIWSENPDVSQIWVSLYTPQVGEVSEERLLPADRERVVAALMHLRRSFPKLRMPEGMIRVYATPPQEPGAVHVRANDHVRVGGLQASHLPLPVRRQSGLLELRLHRVGGARRDRAPQTAGRNPRGGHLRALSAHRPLSKAHADRDERSVPVTRHMIRARRITPPAHRGEAWDVARGLTRPGRVRRLMKRLAESGRCS